MTDRERLEEIRQEVIKNCSVLSNCPDCKYGMHSFCQLQIFIDKALEQGFTFKKKREYIRKSPCKCGASSRCVDLQREFGTYNAYYQCRKCGAKSKSAFTEKSARIEWNKMNEAKNEN